MINKVHRIEFKALAPTTGEFEARVSTFGNVDLQGDRVMPGAFEKSLEEWRASGDPIPVIWSHDWGNPHAHIGYVDPANAAETEDGLVVKGQLDVRDNPFAAQVYKLLAQRRVKEFSFAYDVRGEHQAADKANNLTDLGIIEVGPTLKGANPDTELLNVKSLLEAAEAERQAKAEEVEDGGDDEKSLGTVTVEVQPVVLDPVDERGEKAGRVLSTRNETKLRSAADALTAAAGAIQDVLASLGAEDAPAAEKRVDEPEAKSEESEETKDEEPTTDDQLERARAMLATLIAGK